MSLPKEPRQKMINMMYLVLTALLALNVSAEIINAFKVVDNSLKESNTVLASSTSAVYSSLNDMLKDPKTAEKAGIWQPKAAKAQALAKQTYDLIGNYKLQFVGEHLLYLITLQYFHTCYKIVRKLSYHQILLQKESAQYMASYKLQVYYPYTCFQ